MSSHAESSLTYRYRCNCTLWLHSLSRIVDCAVGEVDDYRVEVLVRLRKLEKLDKDQFTEDERADAEEVWQI